MSAPVPRVTRVINVLSSKARWQVEHFVVIPDRKYSSICLEDGDSTARKGRATHEMWAVDPRHSETRETDPTAQGIGTR